MSFLSDFYDFPCCEVYRHCILILMFSFLSISHLILTLNTPTSHLELAHNMQFQQSSRQSNHQEIDAAHALLEWLRSGKSFRHSFLSS